MKKGIRQIVDLALYLPRSNRKQETIEYTYIYDVQRKMVRSCGKKPIERSLVILSPTSYMKNQFMTDLQSFKHLNQFFFAGASLSKQTWIDTKGQQRKRFV